VSADSAIRKSLLPFPPCPSLPTPLLPSLPASPRRLGSFRNLSFSQETGFRTRLTRGRLRMRGGSRLVRMGTEPGRRAQNHLYCIRMHRLAPVWLCGVSNARSIMYGF